MEREQLEFLREEFAPALENARKMVAEEGLTYVYKRQFN